MPDFFKKQSSANENWFDNLDKIQDGARRNYFLTLPREEQFRKFFSEVFIINRPKGKVGGDGYWLRSNGNNLYVALFTCMGEGHLASMMIRIYINALREVVEGYSINSPGSILQFLHREVLLRFKDRNNVLLNTNANVGIVKINLKFGQMEFAGANIDLIQIDNIESKIRIIEGEKRKIGESTVQTKSYPSNLIEKTRDSSFYFCSNGLFNLVGGSDLRKLTTGDFSSLLKEKKKFTLSEQKIKVSRFLDKWTRLRDQNEDIMIIGFRL